MRRAKLVDLTGRVNALVAPSGGPFIRFDAGRKGRRDAAHG
jgi:hypothetical protein